MGTIRRRLTFSNVVSCLALFAALGGVSYAATQLPKNSVGTKQLKKNAVTTAKLKKNAVTTAKIKNNAVTTAKIADNGVTTAKIADNGVTTAKIGNDAVTGAKVNESTLGQVPNAKTLDGVGTSAFSRAASSSIANNALVGVSGTAREVNITAPQDGFLLAIASADVYGAASNTYECGLEFDGKEELQTQRQSALGPPENLEENCNTNAIFTAKAGTHNVKFNFADIAGTTIVDEAELDVVFIPFAG